MKLSRHTPAALFARALSLLALLPLYNPAALHHGELSVQRQPEPSDVRAISCDFVDRSSTTRKEAQMLGLILLAFLLIESGGLAGGLQHRTSKATSSRADDLFRRNCARCHGADGRGDTPLGKTLNAPDFTGPAWWQKHSDITSSKSLAGIVNHGKGGMPAFDKKLTRTEINLLVNYVRRFRNQSR